MLSTTKSTDKKSGETIFTETIKCDHEGCKKTFSLTGDKAHANRHLLYKTAILPENGWQYNDAKVQHCPEHKPSALRHAASLAKKADAAKAVKPAKSSKVADKVSKPASKPASKKAVSKPATKSASKSAVTAQFGQSTGKLAKSAKK